MSNRNLLIIAAVLIGAWFVLLKQTAPSQLPWNVGQAGSIFQGGQGGGGQ